MFNIQKGYNSVSKTFRLPENLVEKLDRIAYKNNLSLNQLVVQYLNYAIDNINNDEEEKAEKD